jgi:hypothetical protein
MVVLSRAEIESLYRRMRNTGRSMDALVWVRRPEGVLEFKHASGNNWYEVLTKDKVA